MKLNESIINLIENDLDLRLDIAKATRSSEQAIIVAAKRRSKSLLHYASIQAIKNYTKLQESQILEDEKPDTQISKSFPIKAKDKGHAKRATA